MIHNEAEAIKARLMGVEGVRSVTRGWPKGFADLPCIAITKAADTPIERRDDQEYLAELEYYVRIFGDKISQVDDLAPLVDAAMEEMGYTRTFSYDDDGDDVRMQAMRYRKYV